MDTAFNTTVLERLVVVGDQEYLLCFSVENNARGVPDFIMSGIPTEAGFTIMESVSDACAALDEVNDGDWFKGHCAVDLVAKRVDHRDLAGLGIPVDRDGRIMQLVYPDELGYHPWDPDYDPKMNLKQLKLWCM